MKKRTKRAKRTNLSTMRSEPMHFDEPTVRSSITIPVQELPDNKFDRTRTVVSGASKDYIVARDAWKTAVAELEKSDPCSATHPNKVQAAVLTLNNFLGEAERIQTLVRKTDC